jgi:hypothetical protein
MSDEELLAAITGHTAAPFDLAGSLDRIGRFMQSLDAGSGDAWDDTDWQRRRGEVLALLDQVEAELARRGEMFETYGWRLDGRCRWQRVGEEPKASVSPASPKYDEALTAMASVLPDAELIRFVRGFGGELFVDERGLLKSKGAAGVPAAVRAVVRDRQSDLAKQLQNNSAAEPARKG